MAEHLGVSNAAASQMLDRLVEQGLILRSEDPNDRRGKRIDLSEKGSELIKQSIQARHGWVEDFILLFSPEQREQVMPALHTLIEKTRQLDVSMKQSCLHNNSEK
jgi:DNA-binding MarR family transcriptional regulator